MNPIETRRIRRRLLAGPDPAPACEAAATERLYHDVMAGAGDAPPAPATDTDHLVKAEASAMNILADDRPGRAAS